ncbi:restriction endonuclease subunit S [Mycoplasmopsis bovirhinis]|uniref:restriction endonuclease subunit S n=1 Tax=Mycoplasmopsis bovirhinis TaxID=29553 RepID=UPI0012FD0CCD|nr:restriction endonuclease subunit S [Mycoplasmopsis bovirhinis]
MNKIETLIDKLVLMGVEYKKLGDMGQFFGGLTGKAKNDFTNGNCNFITYKNVFNNPEVRLDLEDKVKIAPNEKQRRLEYMDVIFTGSSENLDECAMSSVVTEDPKDDYYLNSFCFIWRIQDKTIFNPHFLKHLFRSDNLRKQLIKTASGVTRYNVSKKLMLNITIPLPPRAIQDEIVKILDNFTELKDRIKQYEYYRDKLLSFDDSKVKVEYRPLKELCSITTGKLNAKDAVDGGIYPFFTCDAKPYSINEYGFDTEAILLSGNGNIGHTNYYNGKFNAYQRTYVLHNFIEVNPKFLLHYINNSFKYYISQKSLNGVISYITLPILQEFIVPVPPLPVQKRIAEVLDNFEKICKDLKIGLPSEIQLRQKQYEYYRNLLLSFNIDDIERERERERERETIILD